MLLHKALHGSASVLWTESRWDSKNRPNCLPRAKFSPSAFAALALVGQFCSLSVSKGQSRGASQAEFCQLLMDHNTTQLCVPGVCQPHSLLFSLTLWVTVGSSCARQIHGWPCLGLYCRSISRVRPRVKRLGQGWSSCTAHGFAYLDINMKQAWMWLYMFSFWKVFLLDLHTIF